MVYSQKYCLVQPITSMKVGDEFAASDWPLHVTIAGVFALNWTEVLHQKFADTIAGHESFKTIATDVAFFGPEQTVKVRQLAMTPALYLLHNNVVTFVEQNGDSFNEPHYLRDDFVPHVTMRGNMPPVDQEIVFHELALIDMFPDSDHTRRRIIKLFPLATS